MTLRFLVSLVAIAAALRAQQVIAPTPEPVGPARGDNVSEYNIVNSFETGYRFSTVDGNEGKYRSDVNYGNGLRLLGSNLTVNSRDGHGRFFDEIVLTTLGLGNDPYESAVLRVQKNGLYRYDMQWRLNDYYNPALTIAQGQHLMNTSRRLQDHDLTLFPQSRLRFRFGYSRNSEDGAALDTTNILNIPGDEFPLFTNVRRLDNEFRLGGDVEIAGIKFTWLRRWEDFKEDTPYFLSGPSAGNNPFDPVTLSNFRRTEPYHGATPGWLATLRTDRKRWAANGRFTYAGGRRHFILDETAIGTDRFGGNLNRQVVVGGDARRPVTTGDLAVSWFPSERLTVVNNSSIHSTRIDGNSEYLEFNPATAALDILFFNFLGMRAITNSTDANLRATNWLAFRAGYQYSDRLIRSNEYLNILPNNPSGVIAEQTNHTHSGIFGIRLHPVQPLTIKLDAEISRADRPFFPNSDRNYLALAGRIQYRKKNLLLAASYRENYNNNSIQITAFSSRARNYSADASWTLLSWMAFDASYAKLHLDTLGGLAFFAGAPQARLERSESLYVSNIHAANLGVHFDLRKRADLFAGYSITRDVGDGRATAASAVTDPISGVLAPVQTFPLSFQSPLARLSIKLNNRLRWNVGWQYYRYREDFGLFSIFQNYRANTGYSSLLWSF
ncbi:MAG TPA: hypothetical protein VJN43_22440 [Bryobacteraceae bacterium]|nr:hypothetical protein [Bryobacteraceae bacterium]